MAKFAKIIRENNEDLLIKKFTRLFKSKISKNRKKRFSLVLAGGKSPIKLYEKLSKENEIPWKNIDFFISDERYVKENSKYSNIKMCRKKSRQIKRQRISDKYKRREIKKINMFYEQKARRMIKKYYDFLDDKNFQEAYNFLKVKKGKYFNKQRLDTFFINSKKLIGHLQILIEIYQFVFIMVDRYKESQ